MNESAEVRRRRAAAEAASWMQRLGEGSLTVSERAEFTDWLRESPIHVSEMLTCQRLSSALEGYSGWTDLAPVDAAAEQSVPAHLASVHSLRIADDGTSGPTGRDRYFSRRNTARWLAGLAAAILIALGALWLPRTRPGEMVLHTAAGERREVTLEDGSIVQLLSDAELRVSMQPHQRIVQVEHGGALFHVAKDRTRPFLVDVATTRVRAVGTIFSVERHADAVVVTVQEGKVEVKPRGAGAPDPAGSAAAVVPLGANERLEVSVLGVASVVHHVDIPPDTVHDDRFRRSTPLTFENARVSEVVAEFNRRNRVQIRIADAGLAARTVSGIFDGQDPQSFVDFLRSMGGATTQRGSDEIVVTVAANPNAAALREP